MIDGLTISANGECLLFVHDVSISCIQRIQNTNMKTGARFTITHRTHSNTHTHTHTFPYDVSLDSVAIAGVAPLSTQLLRP
jgi:hypothetical protein